MRKHLLALLLTFISLNLFAQSNWKTYNNGIIKLSTNNEDYTWLVYVDKAVKINNRTKVREEFALPTNLYSSKLCVSYKDELWISTDYQDSRIFHLKNGIWSSFKNPGTDYISSIGINPNDGTAIFGDPMSDQLIIIKNENMRVINTPDYIEFFSNLCMPSSNSIFYYSIKSLMLIELDTNGVLRNKFNNTRLGSNGIFSHNIFVDKNQNLYAHLRNDGIYKIHLGKNDTTFQKVIPNSTITSLVMETFQIDYNNNIVLKSGAYSDVTLYKVFNSSGVLIKSHNVINGSNDSNYDLVGFDNNSNPISIYKNGLWIIDSFDWNIFYRTINHYNGNTISFSVKGINNKLYFGNEKDIFEKSYDSIKKLSFSDTYHPSNYYFQSMLFDNFGKLYITLRDNGKIHLAYKDANSIINFESEVPNPTMSSNNLNGSKLLLNSESKLCVLMYNSIAVYLGNNTWTSIPTNPNDNILELYSFCKDDNGNIWVGTDKGVAKVVNNQIELQPDIKKKNKIEDLKYNSTNNCLVFANFYNFTTSFCTYNLSTKNLVSLVLQSNISKILIDVNNNAYFQYSNDRILRYNLNTNDWDYKFNDSITNTSFNKYASNIETDEYNRIYIFARDNRTLYSQSIYVYDENAFSAIKSTKNDIYNLSLYPNPSSSTIHINSTEKISKFSIFNMLGELILNENLVNDQIDISKLAPGTYVLKLIGDKGESFRRIVKN